MKADLFDDRARARLRRLPLRREGPAAHRGRRRRQLQHACSTPTRRWPGRRARLRRPTSPTTCWSRSAPATTTPRSRTRTSRRSPAAAAAPCTDPVGPDRPGTVLIDGNPLPQAPKWIANFTARYGMPVGERRVLRLHRLGLPQRSQLLPVRVGRVHRQGAARRRPARRLQLGRRQVRSGAVRPQHHRRESGRSAASTSTT